MDATSVLVLPDLTKGLLTMDLGKIDVVILCGGEGRRLKDIIGDIPKPMARIGHVPFLELLISYLRSQGFRRFILCTGYRSKAIKDYFKDRGDGVLISEERVPLGTAGAIKHAQGLIQSDPFVVINGDSFCKVDFRGLIGFHRSKGAVACMVLCPGVKGDDYGRVTVSEGGRILRFKEKPQGATGEALVNAGVYVFGKGVLKLIPTGEDYSAERDLFPKMGHDLYGYIVNERHIDIGTPQRYEEAKEVLLSLWAP
jgi:NDP-sugar pyrophosphorylase family protein